MIIYFSPGLIKNQCTEWNVPLESMDVRVTLLRRYSVLIFFEIPCVSTIHTFAYKHLKFHFKNLVSPLVIHNQVWYVTRDLHPKNTTMFGSDVTEKQYFKSSQVKSKSKEAYWNTLTFEYIRLRISMSKAHMRKTHTYGNKLTWIVVIADVTNLPGTGKHPVPIDK